VIQRKTQTGIYWQERFQVSSEDVSRIYDRILDAGKPVSTSALAESLVENHCRREESQIQAELSRGPVYQPQEAYQEGQEVLFPALDYVWGTVVGTRPARNPAYGEFIAIQVQFEGGRRLREFASGLSGQHKLNRPQGEAGLSAAGELRSPAELYREYGPAADEKLINCLREHDEFVQLGTEWFLRELLVVVHIGQLNIAEALIEIKGMPVPTAALLADLDLPAEVPEQIRAISLKRALEADARFDNVGTSGRDVWYLRRLTPQGVVNPPDRLVLRTESYKRQDISKELLLIEREIDDESGEEEGTGPSRPIYRTVAILTYPHWRSGTLPLTRAGQGLFPKPTVRHCPVVLVDGQSGERMQGWVVRESSFVFGLQEWFKKHALPVGSLIKIERTRDPRVLTVDVKPERLRRVWVKVATVREGALSFQMQKLPISCQCDEQIILAEDDADAIDELQAEVVARGDGLFDVMAQIVPELVKLSPQGTVHAKTIYSAVNVLLRTPPGPVFAMLSTEPCFVAMGGGYWSFDEARL